MSQKILNRILDQAEEQGPNLTAVFDLDSTLFCTDHRTKKIIYDSIETQEFKDQFPEDIEKVKKIRIDSRDWSIEDIFEREGYDREHPVVHFIYKKWRHHFFNNKYLDFDEPYEGAPEFVNSIKQKEAKILYLTARGEARMREGTIRSLNKWGFPLAKQEHLILKKEEKILDSTYKHDELIKIQQNHKTILFFENEPVILNLIQKNLPEIQLFWIDSTHSRQETPPEKAQVVFPNYKLS